MPKGLAGPAAAADAEVEVNQDKSKKPVDASLPKEATNPKDNLEEPKKVEQVEMQNISGKDVKTESEQIKQSNDGLYELKLFTIRVDKLTIDGAGVAFLRAIMIFIHFFI